MITVTNQSGGVVVEHSDGSYEYVGPEGTTVSSSDVVHFPAGSSATVVDSSGANYINADSGTQSLTVTGSGAAYYQYEGHWRPLNEQIQYLLKELNTPIQLGGSCTGIRG